MHVPLSPRSGKVTRFSGFAIGLGPCGPPWALVGQALVGPLVPCGPGPCGPRGPLLAAPLWAPWALIGQALMASLGTYGPGPDGHPSQSNGWFYGEPAERFGHP